MIKQVIKRNGELQNFQPEKLNGWGIWAASELGPKVDWISAVLHTASTAPEIISTRELQEILINHCLTKASWAYNRMAGRLYISLLYKEMYNNKIPTIKQVFSNLTTAGIMTEEFFTAFSDQDYQDLEQIIDHSIDYKMAHYQIKQSIEKYSLKDRVDQIYYETPQFSNMRVAMRMCQNKGTGKARIARIARHYKQYSSDQTNVPTPYFTNSGTKTSGFLSCCLHQSTDTLGSLAAGDHISYMFTAASAGIGSKVVVRSAGDKVRGGTISHSGRINYLRSQVAAINANLQNGRGGAEAQYVDCIDKEVLNVIPMKNPMTAPAKQVRGLDYGFCFNTHFANLAATNQPYYLFSFADAPELFQAMSSKDPNEFEKLYEIAIKKPIHKIKINARDLMFMVLEQSVEVGQMYTLNLSDCNIHTPFLCPISQSNLCLSGDSLVDIKIDDKFYKVTLSELNNLFNTSLNILVKSYDIETNEIVWSKVTNSALMKKDAKVMKITDDSGKSIVCTPEHKVYTKNRGYVMAKNLLVDDELLLT